MATIHLIEGPVGSGKSTFAAKLCQKHAAPRLILDAWMTNLFRPDRPETGVMEWYVERKQRCITQIWSVACDLIDTGTNAVLELGLIQRADREAFYARVDDAGHDLAVYVLDAPIEVRRARVRERNLAKGSTFAMEVPDAIFELASRLWEPPDDDEIAARRIDCIDTSKG